MSQIRSSCIIYTFFCTFFSITFPRHPNTAKVRYLDPSKWPKIYQKLPILRRYDWMSRVCSCSKFTWLPSRVETTTAGKGRRITDRCWASVWGLNSGILRFQEVWRGSNRTGLYWKVRIWVGARRWFQTFFIFTPILGEMIQFDEHIFQMGWNHQLGSICWLSSGYLCL